MYAILCPFIKHLHAHTVRMGLQITSPPFSTFCAEVTSIYALKIMIPKPDEAILLQLPNIGCSPWSQCILCTNLREFFSNGKAVHAVTGSHAERGHVKKELNEVHARHSRVAWETVHDNYQLTLRGGVSVFLGRRMLSGPYLQITKPKTMRVHGAWLARSQNGQNLLASIPIEAVQRQIMGGEYDWIRGVIVGTANIGSTTTLPSPLANMTNSGNLETPTGPPAKKATYN
ncbi:uncharacterized protein EV420DRAFT_179682 [Desarmillaria tabescens]|uniref:Uncharacterized protein n=1 Tax=Armillaria tabescens TaxID=1929756 RepID=A0AA39N8R0_ARMTA|nr:uncharacterized protein EV420DRAFT_179682 [Desarmillaria tabescens]KAK0461105.1 hypothetical protein EV420DRAFT_179682 [Desarmillaria tabescens]